MKYLKAVTIGILLAAAIGCAAPDLKPVYHGATYDYDVETDFSTIKSYSWVAMPGTSRLDPFNEIRIKQAVNDQMHAKGLRLAPDHPDVFLVMYGGSFKAIDMTVMMDYAVYDVGRLKLAMYDAATNSEIWWSETRADLFYDLTPAEKNQVVETAVQKIMENYPPRPVSGQIGAPGDRAKAHAASDR